jgi:hypothetical protein
MAITTLGWVTNTPQLASCASGLHSVQVGSVAWAGGADGLTILQQRVVPQLHSHEVWLASQGNHGEPAGKQRFRT